MALADAIAGARAGGAGPGATRGCRTTAPLVGLGVALPDGTDGLRAAGPPRARARAQLSAAAICARCSGRCWRTRRCRRTAHDAQGAVAAAARRGARRSQGARRRRRAALVPAQPVAPRARAGRTWRASGCSWSCRCPTTPRPRGKAGSGLADRASGGGGRGLRRSARTRCGGWRPSCGGRSSAPGWPKLARELELPLVPVLARMERHGVRVDLRRRSRELSRDVDAQCRAAGARAAPARRARVQRRLQRAAGAGALRRAEAAGAQAGQDRARPPTRRCWRSSPSSTRCRGRSSSTATLTKLKSTYLDTLPAAGGARTGGSTPPSTRRRRRPGGCPRSDPNLQNIPIRTELGREIRRAFVAERGWQLVSADYSQIELRHPGARRRGPGAGRRRSTHDEDVHTAHRGRGVRRAAGRGHRRPAPRGEDGELRHRLRAVAARPVDAAGHPGRGGGVDHRPLLRALRGHPPLPGGDGRAGAPDRLRGDALRAAPAAWPDLHSQQPRTWRRPPSARRSTCRSRAPRRT